MSQIQAPIRKLWRNEHLFKPRLWYALAHGKPFLKRRWWHPGRAGRIFCRICDGLRWRISFVQPSDHSRVLLDFLGRKQFWHLADPAAVWHWYPVLEWTKSFWLAADGGRVVVYSGGCDRQYADLFPADQFVQRDYHVHPACGRTRADCAGHASA